MHVYKSPYPPEPLYEGSLVDLLLTSKFHKSHNSPVLTDAETGETLTIRDHFNNVRSFTATLKNHGVTRGTVVALFALNNIYLPCMHHAILAAGGVITPVNCAYTSRELGEQLEIANAKFIVAQDGHWLKTAQETVSSSESISSCKVLSFEQFVKDCLSNRDGKTALGDPLPLDKSARETLAYLCFSSGTTGKFKGVKTSHFNLANNVLQAIAADPVIFSPNAIYAGFLPQTHIYALNLHVYTSIFLGAQLIVFPAFDFERFLKAVIRYRISHAHVVPPIMVLFAKSPLVDKYPEIKYSLRILYSGAAPLSQGLADAVTERLDSKVTVCQGYGLTETSPVTHMSRAERPADKVGSIGFLVPNIEARLWDPETGQDAKLGGPGELVVRGPNIMLGYLNNPTADAETLIGDGWMRTGDIARVDEGGYWYIIDRSKEMIKSKGFQVAPAELEALLLKHPHVIDAAVIGQWSEIEATEQPRAFVVLAPNSDAAQIKEWADAQVAKHKRLSAGIVAIDQIPKSPSGKILRRFLKERNDDTVVGVKKLAAKL
ncbi:hypothetical protein V1506DRAFT_451306 [Lipomyces tetrasporus]